MFIVTWRMLASAVAALVGSMVTVGAGILAAYSGLVLLAIVLIDAPTTPPVASLYALYALCAGVGAFTGGIVWWLLLRVFLQPVPRHAPGSGVRILILAFVVWPLYLLTGTLSLSAPNALSLPPFTSEQALLRLLLEAGVISSLIGAAVDGRLTKQV